MRNVIIFLLIFTFLPNSYGGLEAGIGKKCSEWFLSKIESDFKVIEKPNGKLKLKIFKENLVGKILNQVAWAFRKKLDLENLAKSLYALEKRIQNSSTNRYFDDLIASFAAKGKIRPDFFSKIPAKGPVIFYGNHPLSGMDAFVAAAFLQRIRPDLKLIANIHS